MKKYSETGIYLLLFLVSLSLFYPSFKYGFVSDDYNRITIHSLDQLLGNWKTANFRRPIDELYYFSFYNLFGYNSFPYRLLLFVVYLLNSILVYRLVRVLTQNRVMAALVAVFFAANTVQFRNIYWISCNLLLFATTFYFLSALSFLRYLEDRGKGALWGAFAIALCGVILTKEDVITFPLIALLLAAFFTLSRKGALKREDMFPIIRPTLIFWSIPLLFILFRTIMSLAIGGREECPYNLLDCLNPEAESLHRVSIIGVHMIRNFALQWFWNLGSFGIYWLDKPFSRYAGVLEWGNLGTPEYLMVGGSIAGLFLLYWLYRRATSWWYLFIGLIWFIGGLIPTLILPAYIQNYFSALPAVGLFIAMIMPFRAFFDRWNMTSVKLTAAGLVILFMINSVYWMQVNERMNKITISSRILQQLEKDMKQIYPTLQPNTNLVFLNVGQWWLGYGHAPRVMYNDLPLNVFVMEDFVQKEGNLYLKRQVELEQTRTHVFFRTGKGFLEMTPQFFKLYKGAIRKLAES